MTLSFSNLFVRIFSVAVVAAIALPTTQAVAQDDVSDGGLYAALGAGLNRPNQSTASLGFNASSSTANGTSNFGFGTGYNFLADVGYHWTSGLRTELEFDFRHAGVNTIDGASATGDQRIFSFSGNVLYDIHLTKFLVPYIGGGVGIARTHWSDVNAGFNADNFDGSGTKFQWQGIAGVSFPISHPLSLFVDYRYIGVGASKYPGSLGEFVHAPDRSSNIMGGIRIFF